MASLEESFNHLYLYRVHLEQLAVYKTVEVSEMSPFDKKKTVQSQTSAFIGQLLHHVTYHF